MNLFIKLLILFSFSAAQVQAQVVVGPTDEQESSRKNDFTQAPLSSMQWGNLQMNGKDVLYSIQVEEGMEAQFSYDQLQQYEKLQSSRQIVDSYPVEISVREIPQSDLQKKGLIEGLKRFYQDEYEGKSKSSKVLRHATFSIAAAGSVFVWTASVLAGESVMATDLNSELPSLFKEGYSFFANHINALYQGIETKSLNPSQMITGLSISLSINAFFIYFEDFADRKIFKTGKMMGFANRVLSTYEEWKLGISSYVEMKRLDQSERVTRNRETREFLLSPLKKSPNMYSIADESLDTSRQVFMARLLSSGAVNLLIILAYQMIKDGFPLTHTELGSFSADVFLKWGAVMSISAGFSIARGALKDLMEKDLVSEKVVRWYAFLMKAGLTPVYLAMFLDMISISKVVGFVGVPGWIGMLLLSRYSKKVNEVFRATKYDQLSSLELQKIHLRFLRKEKLGPASLYLIDSTKLSSINSLQQVSRSCKYSGI
ncbi:MAG: hypothetical protein VX642_07370 [Bdellovibrionota bacterium]|nr:hypothetical protein [Bdellovibrionota bacterium]